MQMQTQTQFITALGANDPDDGDAGRQQRGLAIAALEPIETVEKCKARYRVPSQSTNMFYTVDLDDSDGPTCTCPDFGLRQQPCKHIYATQLALRREDIRECEGDEKDDDKQNMGRKDYNKGRDWRAYDGAQKNELKHFEVLLRVLCDRIEQPHHPHGRPTLSASDAVYCDVYKIYRRLSRRRVMTDLGRLLERGFIDEAPSDSGLSRFMDHASTTSLLKYLIIISSLPLASAETRFAIDGSGFETQTYRREYNPKKGREERIAEKVKAHVLCGTKTHVVAAAEVSEGTHHDSPLLPLLLKTATENFDIKELTADLGYLSGPHYTTAEEAGVRLITPFKVDTAPAHGDDAWSKAYKFFMYKNDEFKAHYHQRSQAETVFHMNKSKLGPAVKSKNQTAQFNELLCKFIHHNIYCLIQEAYELGIEAELEQWVTEALDRYDRKQGRGLARAA